MRFRISHSPGRRCWSASGGIIIPPLKGVVSHRWKLLLHSTEIAADYFIFSPHPGNDLWGEGIRTYARILTLSTDYLYWSGRYMDLFAASELRFRRDSVLIMQLTKFKKEIDDNVHSFSLCRSFLTEYNSSTTEINFRRTWLHLSPSPEKKIAVQ